MKINQFRKYLLLLPGMLMILGISTVAYAKDGSSGDSSTDSTSQSSSSSESSQSDTSNPADSSSSQTEVENARHSLEQRLQSHTETENSQISKDRSGGSEDKITTEANDILEQLFKEVGHHHSEAERQKNCQAAEHGLETKLTKLQTNSQATLDRINGVLAKVLAYQQAQNLNPTGLTDLLNTANADQSAATAAVASLQALSVNLDCTSSTVPTTVASFKAASQDARTALQTYRQAVKAIITALLNASGTSASSTGGTQ